MGDIGVDYSEFGLGSGEGAGGSDDTPPATTAPPAEPALLDVTVAIDPDTGTSPIPYSIQAATDAKITVTWTSVNAAQVRVGPLGTFDANGSQTLTASDAVYTIVAVAADGSESLPYPLAVHTHEPGALVSQHADLDDGAWLAQFHVAS